MHVGPSDGGSIRSNVARWSFMILVSLWVLTPLASWLGIKAFAPMVALAGILLLPGFRMRTNSALVVLPIMGLVIWALITGFWSPYQPSSPWQSTSVKLVPEAILYLSACFGWQSLSDSQARQVGKVLAISMAGLAILLLVEAATGCLLYRTFRSLIGSPIRPDLGVRNACRALYPLVLLSPAAGFAAIRILRKPILALVMVAGVAWTSKHFSYDAPLLALIAGAIAGIFVYAFPRMVTYLLGIASAAYFIMMPVFIHLVFSSPSISHFLLKAPLSWQQRLGYWKYATEQIWRHPALGRGLDASRTFAPDIQLHPHNSALQIWLELGGVGVLMVSILWVYLFWNLKRRQSDVRIAVSVATMVIYLTVGAVSFGVWQEWWLACAALAAVACQLASRWSEYDGSVSFAPEFRLNGSP